MITNSSQPPSLDNMTILLCILMPSSLEPEVVFVGV